MTMPSPVHSSRRRMLNGAMRGAFLFLLGAATTVLFRRSQAKRTFLVQFACDTGRYLPTARAMAAGGYSALIINGSVGPEGGRMLVEASVKAIEELWKAPLTDLSELPVNSRPEETLTPLGA